MLCVASTQNGQYYQLAIDRLSFIRKTINCICTKHDQQRAQTIQPSDMHTVGVHHVCHDIGRHVSYGRLYRLTWKISEQYQWDHNKCQQLGLSNIYRVAGHVSWVSCEQVPSNSSVIGMYDVDASVGKHVYMCCERSSSYTPQSYGSKRSWIVKVNGRK